MQDPRNLPRPVSHSLVSLNRRIALPQREVTSSCCNIIGAQRRHRICCYYRKPTFSYHRPCYYHPPLNSPTSHHIPPPSTSSSFITMPVIPQGSDFPAEQGSNNNNPSTTQEQRNSSQGTQKASMLDHLSKGPQIPDSKSALRFSPREHSTGSSSLMAIDMPPKVSREEIEARKKELNK